jgi:hypothetical protein
MSQPPPSSEAVLREMALRLANLLPRGLSDVRDQQLYVSVLPPPLDALLPVPENAIILGGVSSVMVHADAEGVIEMPQYTAFLDIPGTAVSALDFFRGQFAARSWEEQPMLGPRRGGFVLEFAPNTYIFTHPDHEGLRISLDESAGPVTQVHVQREPQTRMPPRQAERSGRHIFDLLPPLTPPAGARQMTGSGSGGGDHVHSGAYLITELDLGTVADHYARQIEAAGWQPMGHGQHDSLAWSIWAFSDKESGTPWHSILTVSRNETRPRMYHLVLMASASGKGDVGQSGSWSSSTLTSGG